MPPPFMMPPAGFIPGRAASFLYPRLRPRPRIPSPRSAGVGHDGRIAPLRRQPCRQRTPPLRALSGSGLPHTHSTLGRGGVKAQCLPAAIPHGIGFLSRHAGQSPHPAFPHTMLPLRSFATRRALCQWQGQPECKWQKHSGACRALIFVAAFCLRRLLPRHGQCQNEPVAPLFNNVCFGIAECRWRTTDGALNPGSARQPTSSCRNQQPLTPWTLNTRPADRDAP